MKKNKILFNITLLLLSFSFLFSEYAFAELQDIHISWTYDPPAIEGRNLAGYNFYKEGVKICTSNDSSVKEMDCVFESEIGTFNFTLTAFCDDGFESSHSTNYPFTLILNNPPVARISSSSPIGDAPLTISFNGQDSSDEDGSIKSYLWDFGDETQNTATTPTVIYTYNSAGNYTASLTVTDNNDATDTTTTPIFVTTPPVENESPTARLTVSISEGIIPLSVTFSGSTSTDPENKPLTYDWDFGDETTGENVSVTHIYTTAGSFTAKLTVTDDAGATSVTTTTITTQQQVATLNIELGEVEIDHNWVRIEFENSFINPIVVARAPNVEDNDPSVVRIKDITTSGFDIRIQEWNYLDGNHIKETVSFIVLEQGNYTLDDGTMIEAGKFTSQDTNFQTIQFNTAFTTSPVTMTSIATFNEEDTATGRLRNISTTSFEHKVQEQESLVNGHGSEEISYIAWEPSKNRIGPINVIVDKTRDKVRNRWFTIIYGTQLSDIPIFFGTMQSHDELDTSTVRHTNKTESDIQVTIGEEQSLDDETRHTSEVVGYFIFSKSATP